MSLLSAARQVAKQLAATNHKIAFAESCTAGLLAQSLSRIAGISSSHCGGMVTYRNETKQAYLGIPAGILKKPGPVSEVVARLMAEGVLDKTPEATIGVSITGHLGPHAPPKLDGIVYIGISWYADARRTNSTQTTLIIRLVLPKSLDRSARQKLAAETALFLAAEQISLRSLLFSRAGQKRVSQVVRST
jgi:nicotinamide-nucleotide amidase